MPRYEDSIEEIRWTAESICGTTPSPDLEAQRRHTLQEETKAYKALVESGGRPSHPFRDNTAELFENPGEDRDLLLFWVPGNSAREEHLFSIQCHRWKTFRKFQRFMRERNIEDERAIYIYSGHDFSELREWKSFIGHQKPVAGEEGRFPIYARAVKDRLVRHEFTRTFQLDEDPTKQDSLTTWIEYLGYEYWWYDRYALTEGQQAWLDSKWKDVVASQVLKPFETLESVCGFEAIMQRTSELVRSQEAVESAKCAFLLAQKAKSDPQISRQHSLKQNERRLLQAESRLAEAEKVHEFVARREKVIGRFLVATAKSRTFKHHAERHKILLKWILEQLPMIESEMKQSETMANALNYESISAKSSLNQTDHTSAGEGYNDQDNNNTGSLAALNRQTPIATNSQASKARKHSHDIASEEHPSKRPRRNSLESALPDFKISESGAAAEAAATEVDIEGSQNPNLPASRMTRQKRKAAMVAVEEESDAEEDDQISAQGTSQERRSSKRQKRDRQNRTLSAYKISETTDTAVPSNAAAEEWHVSNTASSRMTRQKRKAATVAAKEERDVKKDDKVSTKDSSQGKRVSKRQKRTNTTGARSAYDKSETADTTVSRNTATGELHASEAVSSRLPRQKSKTATASANKEGNAETDEISSRGAPIRNGRKKNFPSSGAQISSTSAKPVRRSLRIAQKRAALIASVTSLPS
ncbi:hypothetical protein, variant [Blastomyces gilchristii SLH14081]|uniref:Uncharacterized protein n=1 Tax=Blastomyces gilchristii (strain SLH14081) TaxID=559298 RepID=A0A179UXI6_BLAGS|nr:uncharacterized protein BDBG_06078 [Blastomyces gilchristii SLH14081]XP_031579672.1 hypothetical protein, variant [Blastomyces gilchristii SLH14081]OAT11121.1 hypothetical protein BDBG_06078 [Blastomyces gilchristii SLH14081]OAT11122.1 hypothetical protein, variant [Blastomyces gilchristii SLH14081]